MSKSIYLFSPSGAVREKAAFRRALSRLRALGHEVEVDIGALSSLQRFAGDDASRVAAIHRAAASGADWAMATRGGYGLTRILDRIEFKRLARAVASGTQFLGHSDVNALQWALLEKTGAPSWAGPMAVADFGGAAEPDEIMLACFDDVLSGRSQGTGWRLPRRRSKVAGGRLPTPPANGPRAIHGATLWGGNLMVLTSLLGTPWFPQVSGGLLFLEDVGEHPYRIERMLTQLLHAGVLGRQRAILLGQFTQFELYPHDRGFGLPTVIDWLRERLKIPVYQGLPFGHVPTKVMLPIGVKVDLVVQDGEVLVLW
jgi:muramoyltetrapeptide carboxypeptidase